MLDRSWAPLRFHGGLGTRGEDRCSATGWTCGSRQWRIPLALDLERAALAGFGARVADRAAIHLLRRAAAPGAGCVANAEFSVLDFVCFRQVFAQGCE